MRRREALALPMLVWSASCSSKGSLTYILAGQSNMAGRGKLDEAAKAETPGVLAWSKKGAWEPAVEPIHWDRPGRQGFGPGTAFGAEMAKSTGKSIRLIPTAFGGSPLSSWRPGARVPRNTVHSYDRAIWMIRAATKGSDSKLAGIIWHQGETDAQHGVRPGVYLADMVELIGRFRRDLKAPQLPFVAGQLGAFCMKKYPKGANINKALAQLSQHASNVAVVSAQGLTSRDGLHFDTPSYRKLASRYAAAMRGLST